MPSKPPRKRSRRGIRFALLGLILGVSFAIGIKILERYIAGELEELLQDEARKACDCSLSLKSIELSLLRMQAIGKGAVLLQHDTPGLEVEALTADFDPLSEITNGRILLSNLTLDGVKIEDLGPRGATFQFIDSLTTPAKIKKKNKLKVRLLRLEVKDAHISHSFGNSSLFSDSTSLVYLRNPDSTASLYPSLGKLTYERTSLERWQLGDVSGELKISPQGIEIKALSLEKPKNLINLAGLIAKDSNHFENTELSYRLNSESFELPSWIKLALKGEGTVSGPLSDPDITSHFSLQDSALSSITPPGGPEFSLSSLTGKLKLNPNEPLIVTDLKMLFPEGYWKSSSPFTVSSENMQGTFLYSFSGVTLGNAHLLNLQGTLDLNDNELKTEATLGALQMEQFLIPNLRIHADYSTPELNLSLSNTPSSNGSIKLETSLLFSASGSSLKKAALEIENLAPMTFSKGGFPELARPLRLSGTAIAEGPLSLSELSSNGSFVLIPPGFEDTLSFQVDLGLKQGVLSGQATLPDKSLSGTIRYPLVGNDQKAQLDIVLDRFQGSLVNPESECSSADIQARYQFSPSEPFRGDGSVTLETLSLGCDPYTTQLIQPTTLLVQGGILNLPELHLSSEDTDLQLSGSMSLLGELDLRANGNIWLRTLLPLTTQLDNLEGLLEPSLSIKGQIKSPELTGSARLKNGAISLESAGLSMTEISGLLTLKNEMFQADEIQGHMNGGEFSLQGSYSPRHPELSELTGKLERVVFTPAQDLSFVLSSDLKLSSNEKGSPQLAGTVYIDEAEFQREIEFRKFLLELPALLIQTRESVRKQGSRTPEIELNLNIEAPRNVFLLTTLFGTELSGKLSVSGTTLHPIITGELEALNGWVGLREARFEITSGRVEFKQGVGIPNLFLSGETYLPSRTGETVLVILEVEGPLSNPRVSLVSDRGNSEQEILSLLSSGGGFGSLLTRGSQTDALQLRTKGSATKQSFIERFLRRAVRIDTLSFEPKYNPRRGQLEPALVAEKKLLPRLTLLGESFLSNAETGSLMTLQYSLTDKLFALLTLDTLSAEERNAIGSDLKYLILDAQKPTALYRFSGNDHFSKYRLLSELRLSSTSRIPIETVQSLGQDIQRFYQKRGYLGATAEAICTEGSRYCRSIQTSIHEGPQYTIDTIEVVGDAIPPIVSARASLSKIGNQIATDAFRENYNDALTKAFRSEGYLQAQVFSSYVTNSSEKDPKVHLSVRCTTGKPITFVFEGNTQFTSREFLETINLFEREQAFGNNTIRILVKNIERMYRENGFLFASIRFRESSPPGSERTIYTIFITEEEKVPARNIRLDGIDSQLELSVKQAIEEQYGKETFQQTFSPQYAIEELLVENALYLTETLHELGFPDANITHSLAPEENGKFVDINYFISPGERRYANRIIVHSDTPAIELPNPPTAPYSIPRANRYFRELQQYLSSRGYLSSELWSEFQNDILIVHLEAGEQSHIQKITVVGNKEVSTETILQQLTFHEGDPYLSSQLQETRRALLRLGLFSRVELQVVDKSKSEQLLTIAVEERRLQSLALGGGLNSEFGVHAFGEAIEKSLFRDGRSLALRFDTYWDQNIGDVSRGLGSFRYTDPNVLQSGLIHTEEIQFQKLNLSTYEFDLDRTGLSSLLSHQSEQDWSYSFGHTIFQEDLNDVTPDAILGPLDSGIVNLSFLSGSVTYDDRDDPLTPRKGFSSALDWELGSSTIGSDANMTALQAKVGYVFPFSIAGRQFGLANNLRGGSQWTFGNTDFIPISQRYYLGGRTSVRGFRENSLGPRGIDGAVIGGDLLAQTNTELRYYPEPLLSLHLFLDSGSVFLRDESFPEEDWRASYGIGFRYLSPIGPIGFDLGRPIDERPGEPSVRLHFSVGSLF